MPEVLTGNDRELNEGNGVHETAQAETKPEPKTKTSKSEYVLLARQSNNSMDWTEMGTTEAAGPDEAIEMLAGENETVAEAIRNEKAEIVAIAKRFWNVRTPRYTKPELHF